MFGLPLVESACAFGGQAHQFFVVQAVICLRLEPTCQLDFLAIWQPLEGFLDFGKRAHDGKIAVVNGKGNTATPCTGTPNLTLRQASQSVQR